MFNKLYTSLVISALMFFSSFASADDPTPCVIMIGASFADQHWPAVTDVTTKMETVDSRNNLFDGSYLGLCPLLQKALNKSRTVVCPAVAGSMSTDFDLDFGPTHIKAPGYLSQLQQGIHECTSKGVLVPTSLVITLANDGSASIQSTLKTIDMFRDVYRNVYPNEYPNIIVQAYPQTMPNYALEHNTALTVHGPYWGSVIQAFLKTLPTPDQYAQLVQTPSAALSNYGINYLAFFQPDYATREDGVHPALQAMNYAVFVVKQALQHSVKTVE
jgi:hypothetical protein